MSRKTASFSQLLTYISAEEKTKESPVPIFHNIFADSTDISDIEQVFQENAQYCPQRKNGVVLYHEILSLSVKDHDQATPEVLSDLAQKYLSLRAPNALAYGAIHWERNPHIHLMISGNLIHQSKKLRLSKYEFNQVKQELEAYQKAKYPELSHSLVLEKNKNIPEHEPGLQNITRTASEFQRTQRFEYKGKSITSRKDQIREQVLTALVNSSSSERFEKALKEQGITLYQRNHRLTGCVVHGKKYRLRTLGLEDVMHSAQERWQQLPERQQVLSDISGEKQRQQYREWGYVERIERVLGGDKNMTVSEGVEIRR